MDRIRLTSLRYHALHGYYDQERESGNDFEIDLEAHGAFRESIKDDNLSATFDYEQATTIVSEVMNGTSEKLIETLCIRIGDRLFEEMGALKKLSVTVRKMNPPINPPAASAEVTMEWNR